MMTKHMLPALLGASLVLASASAGFAQDYRSMSCDDLWYARNQIYANEGYCFKTQRGIAEFGRNCFPPYGRLSRYEQRQISDIQRWEARYGCN